MLFRTRLFRLLVAQRSLFALWVFLRSDLVHLTPIFKPEVRSCDTVDGVHKFYYTFVDNFVDCPSSVKGCEGMGRISSLNCINCCDDHKKDEGQQPQVMANWLIVVVVVAAVIGLTCVIAVPAFFVVKRRRRKSLTPYPNNVSGSGTRLIGWGSVSSFDDSVAGSTLHGETTYF